MSLLTEEILKDVELKKLIDTEKTARLENELEKNRAICKQILSVVQNRNDFKDYTFNAGRLHGIYFYFCKTFFSSERRKAELEL